MNERIDRLIEELAEAVREAWPEGTKFSLSSHIDGYRNLTVVEWKDDETLPIEEQKRREVYDSYKLSGVWTTDRSQEQNDFYRKEKVLLEKAVSA